jgi:hypothetical protein
MAENAVEMVAPLLVILECLNVISVTNGLLMHVKCIHEFCPLSYFFFRGKAHTLHINNVYKIPFSQASYILRHRVEPSTTDT